MKSMVKGKSALSVKGMLGVKFAVSRIKQTLSNLRKKAYNKAADGGVGDKNKFLSKKKSTLVSRKSRPLRKMSRLYSSVI